MKPGTRSVLIGSSTLAFLLLLGSCTTTPAGLVELGDEEPGRRVYGSSTFVSWYGLTLFGHDPPVAYAKALADASQAAVDAGYGPELAQVKLWTTNHLGPQLLLAIVPAVIVALSGDATIEDAIISISSLLLGGISVKKYTVVGSPRPALAGSSNAKPGGAGQTQSTQLSERVTDQTSRPQRESQREPEPEPAPAAAPRPAAETAEGSAASESARAEGTSPLRFSSPGYGYEKGIPDTLPQVRSTEETGVFYGDDDDSGAETTTEGVNREGSAETDERIVAGSLEELTNRRQIVSKKEPELNDLLERNPNLLEGKRFIDVRISFDITPSGFVTNVSLLQSSGISSVDARISNAMRQWKFVPLKEDQVRRTQSAIVDWPIRAAGT